MKPSQFSAPRVQLARLAYLTTAYPSVSHTFIRREIRDLERRGHSILRVAIRPGLAVVDEDDQQELTKTTQLLGQSKGWLLVQVLRGLVLANVRVLPALCVAWRFSRASERGLLRHLAYVIEALILRSFLHAQKVAHVHVHFGTNAAAVALLTTKMGGPTYSMTVHGPDEFDAPIGLSLQEKIRASSFTVGISGFCSAQLRRWVPYAEWRKIHVIRCTVGDEWFQDVPPVDEQCDSIVSVGRYSEQKGQLLLVDAFGAAVNRGMKGRLVLVGDGELRPELERRIKNLGLEDRVTLTGWCSGATVRNHIRRSRALVLPSFAEGLPVVIMEAMALKRPIVASRIMGIPELVEDGVHGWLVASGDEASLVDVLLKVDEASVEQLRVIGEACQSRVCSLHTVDTEGVKLDVLLRPFVLPDSRAPVLKSADVGSAKRAWEQNE